jgi:hypothetical protein
VASQSEFVHSISPSSSGQDVKSLVAGHAGTRRTRKSYRMNERLLPQAAHFGYKAA